MLLRGALAGELTHHLGYANGAAPEEVESHRNGYSEETVVGEEGAVKIEVPRDRSGSFEPLLIAKGEKRFEGVDEKIIAMYARGMKVREIQGFLCGWKERQALARELKAILPGRNRRGGPQAACGVTARLPQLAALFRVCCPSKMGAAMVLCNPLAHPRLLRKFNPCHRHSRLDDPDQRGYLERE